MSAGGRLNFQGGIYCVIPMGKIYDESIRKSAHRRFYRLFGEDAEILREKTLIQGIVYEIDKMMSEEMSSLKYADFQELRIKLPKERHLSQSYNKLAQKAETWDDIIEQIEKSYGFAIYHNGRQVEVKSASFSKSRGGISRLQDFFELNKNKLPSIGSAGGNNVNNWNIVIAVAHNIAARFEATGAYPDRMYKGFGKMVLLHWAQEISNKIRSKFGRVNMPVQYGYILSRQGYEGQVYRSTRSLI